MTTARKALDWMKNQADDQSDCVLFRGQNRVWTTIKPSITRDDEQTMKEMWRICFRFVGYAASGVTGYSIPNEYDRLAILQHYIGRSPVLDLTGTPEVALYFALLEAVPGKECVVYSIDRSTAASSPDLVFSDHSFLVLPLNDGGSKHRWLRQDGYSVCPKDWRDLRVAENFDLLKIDGVKSWRFIKGEDDDNLVRYLGDLEDTTSDELAHRVRGAFKSVAKSFGDLTPGVRKILEKSNTLDAEAELVAEIDYLIFQANTSISGGVN